MPVSALSRFQACGPTATSCAVWVSQVSNNEETTQSVLQQNNAAIKWKGKEESWGLMAECGLVGVVRLTNKGEVKG